MSDDQIKIRLAYQQQGVEGFYQSEGHQYYNPHEFGIIEMTQEMIQVLERTVGHRLTGPFLDLCCGSGEVTEALLKYGYPLDQIKASDPYTYEAYEKRIAKPCEKWNFVEISQGQILADLQAIKPFQCVICSFALHLCPLDLLDHVLYQLSLCSDYLIILTPHKKPEIQDHWLLLEERYSIEERVRGRLYFC
jgi:phospholipid N-methyltransferase